LNAGIVLRKDDAVARGKAAKCGVAIEVRDDWALPWPQTLFIAPGTCVPWDLVAVGFNFLNRWDVAAPFWRAGVLAKDIGTPAERERTTAITHDLRVPIYSHELLFVRNSPAGQGFVKTWRTECANGDERLAFLRALYMVKPTFCVLPRLWLADIAQREISDRKAAERRPKARVEPLVAVEVTPGRWVKCYKSDAEKIKAQYGQMNARRERALHGRG